MNARVELAPAREVCPTTTRRLIGEGALLVDVRERAEIERVAFDVPDVVAIPLAELEQRYAELPRDRELVLVCQGGGRSLKATYFLMYQGYTRVANMEGGILKWAAKGFPIKGNPAVPAPTAGGCCAPAASPTVAGSCCDSSSAPAAASGCCGPASAGSTACCAPASATAAPCC
jgi:rhodanese-related sulfurtransferase